MNREEAINYLLEKEFIVEKEKEQCYFCGGTGRIKHDDFHMGRTYYQTCPKCEGKGYKEKMNYRIKEEEEIIDNQPYIEEIGRKGLISYDEYKRRKKNE